ncbi:MAG: phosphatidylglycerol lysyltransferase domain-containing protein [Paramuribaculum sp.]|nr:phosphatidylglycerol lysyltransferase domain-containing protein [Paramuribaculum sp.]
MRTSGCSSYTTSPRVQISALEFRPMAGADVQQVASLLKYAHTRTCDFTVGGMFMWADWFNYRMCVYRDTLFVKGMSESDCRTVAFSLPVGKLAVGESVRLLKDYCMARSMPMLMSAVPREYVEQLMKYGATRVEELPDWADYLYDIDSLATFAGKKLNKKRNHINRFISDNPDYAAELITAANIGDVKVFFSNLQLPEGKPLMAEYDRCQVKEVLENYDDYPFEGILIRVPGKGVVAFAVGEVKMDTLVVHIEKMDHSVTGAGEIVCRDFALMMKARYPYLRYENREDDAGDEGLRQAKLSLHPCSLLGKYNVYFD